MAVKRTTVDKYFSKCIRLRTNWICEYCEMDFSHDIGSLHCSHFVSRNNKIVRFNPSNAFAHCYKCHELLGGGRWGGGNIAEFANHYDEIHGADQRELIRTLSSYPFPRFKRHEKAMAKYYREIMYDMETMRNNGECGRIEFDMYEGCDEINELMEKLRNALH